MSILCSSKMAVGFPETALTTMTTKFLARIYCISVSTQLASESHQFLLSLIKFSHSSHSLVINFCYSFKTEASFVLTAVAATINHCT